jgi:hypothetical protein
MEKIIAFFPPRDPRTRIVENGVILGCIGDKAKNELRLMDSRDTDDWTFEVGDFPRIGGIFTWEGEISDTETDEDTPDFKGSWSRSTAEELKEAGLIT